MSILLQLTPDGSTRFVAGSTTAAVRKKQVEDRRHFAANTSLGEKCFATEPTDES